MSFLASTKAVGASVTSGAIDASGANGNGLFIAIVSGSSPVSAPSDNSANPWTPLTAFAGASGGEVRIYYSLDPTATASHTFTNNAAVGMIEVLVFSGHYAFDQQTGTVTHAQAGAITPPVDGTVFIAGYGGGLVAAGATIAFPFTLVDTTNVAGGVNYSDAAAYYIQPIAAVQDPIWTVSGGTGGEGTAVLAAFTPVAGGGGGTNWGPSILSASWNRLVIS